jgi:hypothetical protein
MEVVLLYLALRVTVVRLGVVLELSLGGVGALALGFGAVIGTVLAKDLLDVGEELEARGLGLLPGDVHLALCSPVVGGSLSFEALSRPEELDSLKLLETLNVSGLFCDGVRLGLKSLNIHHGALLRALGHLRLSIDARIRPEELDSFKLLETLNVSGLFCDDVRLGFLLIGLHLSFEVSLLNGMHGQVLSCWVVYVGSHNVIKVHVGIRLLGLHLSFEVSLLNGMRGQVLSFRVVYVGSHNVIKVHAGILVGPAVNFLRGRVGDCMRGGAGILLRRRVDKRLSQVRPRVVVLLS